MITSYEDIVKELPDNLAYPVNGYSKIIYCPLEHVHDWFANEKDHPPYVLVSGNSDFGIHEQKIDHPNFDLGKLLLRTDITKAKECPTDVYGQIVVGPGCDPKNCKPEDRFSIKIDSFTLSTFNEVPENVIAWYSTNVNVSHPKIKLLPFGLNWQGDGTDLLYKEMQTIGPKGRSPIYANFNDFCLRRVTLKKFLGEQNLPNVSFRRTANLAVEMYLKNLAAHKFVLCPPGNGLDCYRTMETIYLGAVPVLEKSVFSELLSEMIPVHIVEKFEDFCQLPESTLKDLYDEFLSRYKLGSFTYPETRRSYWKQEFERCLTTQFPV